MWLKSLWRQRSVLDVQQETGNIKGNIRVLSQNRFCCDLHIFGVKQLCLQVFSPLLPDGATLLRFEIRPFCAFEVFCKLGKVGKGNVHPPRSRRVAGFALHGSCLVNSTNFVADLSEDSPDGVREYFDSWYPDHSVCTSQMHDPPWWKGQTQGWLIIGKTTGQVVTQKSWFEVKLKPGTHFFADAGSFL